MSDNKIKYQETLRHYDWDWKIPKSSVAFDPDQIKKSLHDLDKPCFFVLDGDQIGVSHEFVSHNDASEDYLIPLCYVPQLRADQLGDFNFRKDYGVRFSYYTGAMANGIASEKLVISTGKAGILGSFGAAGLVPSRVEAAIQQIQGELPNGPYAFNLIHSPSEPALESGSVNLYLKYGVHVVESSAFLSLTPNIVYYRVAGLKEGQNGEVITTNKVIAKISRTEVADKFMRPAPQKFLAELISQGLITEKQARMAETIPMADDITVEADSGGHTDNRPLVVLLPEIINLRNQIQKELRYIKPVRVGAAGGIGTAMSALAAFNMGSAYVTTGSVNQSCIEAGSSEHTRKLLCQTQMTDVAMAPAADMFEMGVKLQVLKRGTLFPMRAQKLYDIYSEYNSIDEIPKDEKEKLEKQVFRKSLEEIWQGCVSFFNERDPQQIERAKENPKRKMALVFRWYLGLSSRWSNAGEAGREMDYQIWCGPAMGGFNSWVKNSYLEEFSNRRVVDVAVHIMNGAAYLERIFNLRSQGLVFGDSFESYIPQENIVKNILTRT